MTSLINELMTLETRQKLLVMLGMVIAFSLAVSDSAYANHGVGRGHLGP